MKTTYVIAASLLLSATVFAQKDELRALKKLDSSEEAPNQANMQQYKAALDAAEAKMNSATDEQKAEFYYYKGNYHGTNAAMSQMNPAVALASLDTAIESFNKVLELEKKGKGKYSKQIQDFVLPEVKATMISMASAMGKAGQYKQAVPLFEMAYKASPKDTLYLYNAAAYAVNAKDYDTAINYFNRLEKMGFTGKSTNYTAKNSSGQVEYYADRKVRDLLITQKTHTEPGVYKEPSKRADIIKNIALIYVYQGKKEEAMAAIAKAKKEDPNDMTLLQAEADIYLKQEDYTNYNRIVTQILNSGSKDPNLYFNLGVTTSKSGSPAEAEKYYLKAIELKPDMLGAYQNLAVLQLEGEDKIVNEMNNLGTSTKDMKRYDELKKQRDDKYRKALKYLEQAYKIDPKNEDIKSMLGTIYQGLDMEKEYQALKKS